MSVEPAEQQVVEEQPKGDQRIRQIVQIVADLTGGDLAGLRVLDLACLSGYFSIEFAMRQAQVLGIEGREIHVENARLAKQKEALSNVDFVLDDVRNLSKEKYGEFDIVLCLGILYHLDVPDVFHLVQNVAEVCRRFAIIDTHISLVAGKAYTWNGRAYWGRHGEEHRPDATPEEKLRAEWDSLDNVLDFWLTRSSLCNLLRHVGFTSVYECRIPLEVTYVGKKPRLWRDRITLLAIKGKPVNVLISPETDTLPLEDWPEKLEGHYFEPPPDRNPGKRGRRKHLPFTEILRELLKAGPRAIKRQLSK